MRPWLALPVLLLALPASAAEAPPWDRDFLESSPHELLRAVRELPPPPDGTAIEVLLEEATHRFDEQGGRESTYRTVYRVLPSADLVQASTFTATWVPSREDRPRLQARVIAADGQVVEFAADTVGEGLFTGQEELGNDGRRLLVGRLPGVAPGAVVEKEVAVRAPPPRFPENQRFAFRGVPTRLARVRLDFPLSRPVRFAVRGISLVPEIHDEGGRRSVVFEAGPLPAVPKRPPGAPFPEDPQVIVGTSSSWGEVAQAWHAVVEQRVAGSGADVRELVEDLPRTGGTDALVAALLERIAARAPYAPIGQTGSFLPREPAETLTRGRGGPMDLAVLMVAALRSLGIEAGVVLVGLYPPTPDPDFPGVNLFEHAVVVLPGPPTRYVDPSDPASGGRYLPVYVQGKPALVVAPTTTGLGRLPAWKARDTTYRTDVSLELAERGPARLTYRHENTGAAAALKRSWYAKATDEQRAEFRKNAGATLKAEGEVLLTTEPGEPGENCRERMEVARSQLGSSDAQGAEATLPLGDLLAPLPDEVKPTSAAAVTHDVLLAPFVNEVTVRVVPPPGFAPRGLPPETRIVSGPVTLVRQFEASADGAVTARARLDTGDGQVLAAADAEALRVALGGFAVGPVVRFERTAAALFAAGKIREAVEEERRLIALHPREALHHEELARMLLDLGLGEAAKAEARTTAELEPSATSYVALGLILQHDALGRRYRPGWDRAGSLAAFRRALELERDDDEEVGRVATLLARGDEGGWLGPGAEVETALAMHRRGHGFIGGFFRINALAYLFHTGRFEELVAVAHGFEAGGYRDQVWLAALAVTQGTEAALRKAEELLPNEEERGKTLASLSATLANARHYDLAAEVVERRAVGARNAHELASRAASLRRLRRLEARPRKAGDPSAVFDRLLDLLVQARPPEADIRALLAEALEAEQSDLDLQRMTQLFRPGPEEEQGVLAWADGWASGVERDVEGDDASGYRVRLRWQGGSRVFHVVREDGAYRLRSFGPGAGPLGAEALACLARGDAAGARRWLAWAAEGSRFPDGEGDRLAAARRVVDRGDAVTAGELERAAAVLAAFAPVKGRIERALEARRTANDPVEAMALDQGLAFAAYRNGGKAEAAAIAERLAARFPLSRDVLLLRLAGLTDQRERLAVIAAVRPIAERANATALLASLASSAAGNGDFALSDAIARERLDAGRESSSTLNLLAWNSLFRPTLAAEDLDRAIGWAREAVRRDADPNGDRLHTLASLLAESGRVREALDTLRASTDRKHGRVDPPDFYVVGRVAEWLGLTDEAAAAYRTASAGARDSANETAVLARRRLEALERPLGTAGLPSPGTAGR